MAEKPLISIITINKDNAAGLYATLRSAESLDYPRLEHIVMDGASQDGSLEIARDLAHQIDIFISEPDSGLYQAMNKGAARASGDWVIFMNSGDCFAAPSVLGEIPVHSPADIIHGRVRSRQHGHVRDYAKHLWQGMTFCHQAALTRPAWLQRFPFDESREIVGDWEFFVKCDRAGAKFRPVRTVIAEVDDAGRSYGSAAHRAALRLPIALRHYGWDTPELAEFYETLLHAEKEAM